MPRLPSDNRCFSCAYAIDNEETEDTECHRFPPHPEHGYLLVDGNLDWCGEWLDVDLLIYAKDRDEIDERDRNKEEK